MALPPRDTPSMTKGTVGRYMIGPQLRRRSRVERISRGVMWEELFVMFHP
jgi:hypothetical protein